MQFLNIYLFKNDVLFVRSIKHVYMCTCKYFYIKRSQNLFLQYSLEENPSKRKFTISLKKYKMCNMSFTFPSLFILSRFFFYLRPSIFSTFYRNLIGSRRDERLLHKDIAFLQLPFIRLALKGGEKKCSWMKLTLSE